MPTEEKPVLVMVSGLGGTGAAYAPLLKHFRGEYEIRAADHLLRFPSRLSWNFFFSAIDRALAGREGYLLGHSLGGAIALKYAASHPDRIKGTVAIAPILFDAKPGKRRGWEAVRLYRYARLMARSLASGPLHALRVVRVRRHIFMNGRGRRLYRWTHTINLAKDLAKLTRATVLWPEKEELLNYRNFERLQREFPNVRSRVVPGSHNTAIFHPRHLAAVIKEELRG